MVKIKQFTFILSAFFIAYTKADQLALIDKANAIKAVEYLRVNSDVVLFCGCCDGDIKKKIHVYQAIYKQDPKHKEYYEVSITYEYQGDSVAGWEKLDLAYVHTQINGLWTPLGKVIGMECDPCIEPFVFEVKDRKQNDEDVKTELIDWTGQYFDEFNNILTIVGPNESGEVKFKFSGKASLSCQEDSKSGIAFLSRIYVANYQEDRSKCHLNFSLNGDDIEVSEYDCDHGASCGNNNGLYTKRK